MENNKRSNTFNYLDESSSNQELTFEYAILKFKENGLEFTEKNLKDKNGKYTNLALLLSDQCEQSIRVAVFQGTTNAIVKKKSDFAGSIFKQLDEALNFILERNELCATFDNIMRHDKYSYNPITVREALMNAVLHRDYSYCGSILVKIYDDKITIMSLGGFVEGITLDSIKQGTSLPRNPKLVDIFYRLKLVEAYGIGVPRIFEDYLEEDVHPVIDNLKSSVYVVLPNKNYADLMRRKFPKKLEFNTNIEQDIYYLIKNENGITRNKINEITGVSKSWIFDVLKSFLEKGYITQKKQSREYKYYIKN